MSKITSNTVSLDLLLEELAKFPAKDGKYTYNDIVYAASVVSRLPKPKKTTKTSDSDDSKTSSDEAKTSSDEAKMTWNEFKKKRNAELKDSIKDAVERQKKISEEWTTYKEANGLKTKAKSPKKEAKAETKKTEPKAEPKVETKVADLKAILNDMSDDDSEPNSGDEYDNYADDE